jgi:hypothetical protein
MRLHSFITQKNNIVKSKMDILLGWIKSVLTTHTDLEQQSELQSETWRAVSIVTLIYNTFSHIFHIKTYLIIHSN